MGDQEALAWDKTYGWNGERVVNCLSRLAIIGRSCAARVEWVTDCSGVIRGRKWQRSLLSSSPSADCRFQRRLTDNGTELVREDRWGRGQLCRPALFVPLTVALSESMIFYEKAPKREIEGFLP